MRLVSGWRPRPVLSVVEGLSANRLPGTEWLELLCKHIPDRYEHLVRYCGWYSNRARGERAKKVFPQAGGALPAPSEEPATEFAARAKAAWARLIRKVYEVPLECPKCKGRCASLR